MMWGSTGRKKQMMTAEAQTDAIWLQAADYRVVPLNPRLSNRVADLKRALDSGVPAYADASRQDFYDVELPGGWAYIHVREDKQLVYLVAYSRD
jgi:hypothetical protein